MDGIARVLELMGRTPDHVAATLRGGDLSGLRDGSSELNPIVRYLKQTLDLDAYPEIGPDSATLILLHEDGILEMELPVPVRSFLERYHNGMYPDLKRA